MTTVSIRLGDHEKGNWTKCVNSWGIDHALKYGIIKKGEDVVNMAREDRNLLDYIVVCISEFANRYQIHMNDAYVYLSKNKGIEFLKEFYDVEHTLSFDDVLDDLTLICKQNGGILE